MDNQITYNDGFEVETPAVTAPVDTYTRKRASNGRELYFKNGKLVAQRDIPEGVMVLDADTRLAAETVDQSSHEDKLETAARERGCIWGDGPDDFIKFVNGGFIYLCQQHYETASTGAIVKQLRDRV